MNPCKTCERAGLPILLVRPTAIATDAAFAPAGAARLLTHEASVKALGLPALRSSRYGLRMLRQGGFVYAYYTRKPPQLATAWQAFRVSGSGALIPEGQFEWSNAEATFSCAHKPTHPNDVRTLCIQLPAGDPASAGPVWVGFSMNWWDTGLRQRVQADPKAAGMTLVNPLVALGGVAQAFKADAASLEQYVAEFALASMEHGLQGPQGKASESSPGLMTPFYNKPYDKTLGQAASAVKVMHVQGEGHPLTLGREFVLTLADPVGLAADLNGLRLTREWADREAWRLTPEWSHPQASWTMLEGLRKALVVGEALRLYEDHKNCSEKQWQARQFPMRNDIEPRWAWRANAQAGYAEDGSRSGVLTRIGPGAAEYDKRMRERAANAGQRDWERIVEQLDKPRFEAWPARRSAILGTQAQRLAEYEGDWLAALADPAIYPYFGVHFDENAAGDTHGPDAQGQVYAAEANLLLYPQPFLNQAQTERWAEQVLGTDIIDPRAIALRALFANQKSVIEKVHALLIGQNDRSDGDSRDKTYDLFKGVLTHELGQRFNWMHPRLMALSIGGLASMGAGVLQLASSGLGGPSAPPSRGLKRYMALLPRLTLAQQQLDRAIEGSRPGGNRAMLSMVVLLKTRVSAQVAVEVLNGYAGQAVQADRVETDGKGRGRVIAGEPRPVIVAQGNSVELSAITDVETALAVKEGRLQPAQVPGQRVSVAATGGRAPQALEDVMTRAKALNLAEGITPAQLQGVIERRVQIKEFKLNTIDSRLALGAMIVQGLGLYQGVPQLLGELNRSQRDQGKLKEAALGAADSLGGFIAGSAELWASQHKARLLMRPGGEHLVEASGKLAVLRTSAALMGVAGGVINAVLMADKAAGAKEAGDEDYGYSAASVAFIGTAAMSSYGAADAATNAAVSRFVARQVLMRFAGIAATEAVLAGTVASIVSGVGLVLLLAGIAAYVYAVLMERDSYQRWAGRGYFGTDKKNRFADEIAEAGEFDAITWEGMAAEEARRMLQRHPEIRPGLTPPSEAAGAPSRGK